VRKLFIDLFSGAGGLSCGLEMSGFKCLVGIDQDKTAIETFKLNHPHAQAIAGDIRTISAQSVKELIGHSQVTLICGGPPCQGFSTIGKNNQGDERNFLFWEFVRFVEAFTPDYILVENVTGLLARKNESILQTILNCFTEKLGLKPRPSRTAFLDSVFMLKLFMSDTTT
jgi:DNA (cytosine-5)-methyltransferase 1